MSDLNQILFDKVEQAISSNEPKVNTPCYIFDASVWSERYNTMKNFLGGELICSFKANPNSELVARTKHVATSFEVASLNELSKISPHLGTIYANNPSMDATFLRSAVAAGAHLVVDSLAHLDDIAKVAKTASKSQSVNPLMVRLNACVLTECDPDFNIREDHFGMDLTNAMTAIDRIRDNEHLSLAGFHLFVGSYTFRKAATKIGEVAKNLIEQFEQRYGAPISFANLGGGFSEKWPESMDLLDQYRTALSTLPDHVQILHESGRGIYASCGVFVTTVVRTKIIDGRHYAICDGGLNQNFLLGQTENRFVPPQAPRIIYKDPNSAKDAEPVTTTFVGSTCSKDDVIGRIEGAPLSPGDKCVFMNCGAYNSTYTVSDFLGLKEPEFYVFP